MDITRRHVGALLAASAVAAGPLRPRAARAGAPAQLDAIVLGAGVSGLNTAWLLEQQGLKVLVLEGRKRVGGRVHTEMDAWSGVAVERGAEFVQGRPPSLIGLAKQHRFTLLKHEGSQWLGGAGGLRPAARLRATSMTALGRVLDSVRSDQTMAADACGRTPAKGRPCPRSKPRPRSSPCRWAC